MKKLIYVFLFLMISNAHSQVLSEGFESGIPNTWATFETGIGVANNWASSTSLFCQGSQAAFMQKENVTDGQFAIDWLVTPQVVAPANGQLRFWTKQTQSSLTGTEYTIRVSTTSQTNPASFTTVATWDEASLNTIFNVCEEKVVDLSSYAPGTTLWIAFVMKTDNGDRWIVDNVNYVQKCNAVTGLLNVSSISTTTAQLSWTSPTGVTQFDVQVAPVNDAFGGLSTITYSNVANPFVASGLQPNTLYKYQVRAVCSGGFPSDWYGPKTFETVGLGETCAGPIVATALPYTNTENTSNFADNYDTQVNSCIQSATNYISGNDVYYSYTPTANGNIAVTLIPTSLGASFYIYNGCPGSGGTCLTGKFSANGLPVTVNPFAVTAGTNYIIVVSSNAAVSQTVGYTLQIQQVFCTEPNALTATVLNTTSASLSWGNPSGANSWEVSVAPAPYGLPTGTGTTVNANTGYVFSGISGVVYQYYVRANCNDANGNFSMWAGPFTFTFLQVAENLPFTDDFETIKGWTLNNGSQVNKWAIGSATNNGGTKAMYVSNNNGTNNAYSDLNTTVVHAYKDFIIPTGSLQANLKFDWKSNGEALTDVINVYVAPTTTVLTPGTAIVPSLANGIKQVILNLGLNNTYSTFIKNDLLISSFAGGNMRLIFEWKNNNSLGVQTPAAIDNIELSIVTCPKPQLVNVSAIVHNQAQINWTNGASETQWEFVYLPQGSPSPTNTTVGTIINSASPFMLTGLASITCYDVYIRAICGASNFSYWSDKVTFCTTPDYCSGDHLLDSGGLNGNYQNGETITKTVCPINSGDVVTVVFNSFNLASGDNLIIRNGDLPTSPIVGTYTGNSLPTTFTSTSSSGCLTFVFTSDATANAAGFDATIYCTSPITCFKPTQVLVSNVTGTSAEVSWVESGTSTQWEILALPQGSNVPAFSFSGVNASNPFLITGLTPSTAYTFYVRSVCSTTNKSFWTDGVNFTTTPINDLCTNAVSAFVNNDLFCSIKNQGELTGASNTTIAPATTCSSTASDVWYVFTASRPTHTFQLSNIVGGTVNLALYTGTCNNLTLFSNCGLTSAAVNGLVVGQTYYVRVYTSDITSNNITFDLCIGGIPCSEAESLCNTPKTYSNTTGVINLGQWSCLGTSPNASFFFLEATQNGALTYTITQVTTGGNPIDVDYALWGPFSSRNLGCISIPNDSPVQCSYSAAATENFTVNALAGQVYILMVTNFANQAGSVTITPNQSNTAQVACYPSANFKYNQIAYCNDSSNEIATLINNAIAGTFSATPSGLSINSTTGEINFTQSLPGTYLVTNTVVPNLAPPASNAPIEDQEWVIVTARPNATISYANAPYCNADSDNKYVTITGTGGPNASFSSTPNGLQYALDPVSGTITPALASPGIYNITMSIPAQGGCPAYSTNTTVEIKQAPQVPLKFDVNGCNSYTLPALTTGVYYTGPNASGNQLNAGDIITTPQVIYVYVSNGDCWAQDSFKVNIVNIPAPTASVTSQPTCSTQTGNMQVLSPLTESAAAATNIFISEVTDSNTGSLSYIELFNPTNAPINLSNYRLKVFTVVGGNPSCNNIFANTDIIAPNSTYVIKLSADANIPGIVPNKSFTSCSGFNNNDRVELTTFSTPNIVIDAWGPSDGTIFTPNGQPGYTYRRIPVTPIPNVTWTPVQWSTVDPENYSNIGQYSLYVSNYEYAVDNGTFQSGTTFTGLTPGSHTLIVHDLINDCYSSPSNFTINAVPYTDPVTSFTYTTPVCNTSTTNPTPALATGFTSGGTFTATPAGLDINSTTGVINLTNSTLGSYVVTYTYPGDLTNCINSGTSNAPIVLSSIITPSFNPVAAICSGGTLTALPTTSINNIIGSWSPALNNTATTTYTFTPNAGQCAVSTNMTITVNPNITAAFTQVSPICSGDVMTALPTTSTNGITGTWSPALNNTNTTTYTFTPTTGQCANGTTMTITVNPFVQPTFTSIADLCVGAVPIALPSTSNNGVTGVWSPSTVNTASAGTTVYNFTPNGSGCYLPASLTVSVHQCQIQRGISPNGDGLNDYLDLTAEKVEIFNRYGSKVYSKVNYHNDWFGQSDSGSILPDGTYYYSVKLLGGELKTGWIYINKEN